MFNLGIMQNDIDHAKDLVSRYNFGTRGYADGTSDQQFIGLLGQCVVQRNLGLGYAEGSDKHDGGVDFEYNGIQVDVKTMGRTSEVKPFMSTISWLVRCRSAPTCTCFAR